MFILMGAHYVRVLAVPYIFYNNFGHLAGLKNMFFIEGVPYIRVPLYL